MMAKLFSIVMSGLILIQSLDIAFDDLGQLDELLEHAEFHAEKYGDNLWVFISKHYGELKEQHNKDHQEERKEHEKLPFQNQCHCASVTAIITISNLSYLISTQTPETAEANFYYQLPVSSLHANGLFQPPQPV